MKKYNFTHNSAYVKKLVDEDFYNVQSFQELDDKIAALPENWQEGASFEGWVEGYLEICEESVDTYIHSSQISQEVKDEWKFPISKNKDYGIDGILYNHDDPTPTAVQIKFQSKKRKIDFRKLGTFGLAAQGLPYGKRLIIHNQTKVDDALPKDSYISIGRKDFNELESKVLKKINEWLKGSPAENTKEERREFLQYRNYQDDECVPQVRKELTNADRAIIHAVQASGKTFMVIKCVLDLLKASILKPNMNAVIVVPARQLVHHWLNAILRWIPTAKVLPVCTPEELISEEGNTFSLTDVVDIAKWLKENDNKGASFCLVTLDSYPAFAQAVKLAGINKLDFGCVDEAHNATGLLTQRKTFFLQDRVLKIGKRLAVSGTFLIRVNLGMTGPIASMDDVSLFGNVAFRYLRKRAIDEGMICNHKRWYSVNITDTDVDEDAVEFDGVSYRADWTSGLYAFKHFIEGPERDVKNCIFVHNKRNRSRAFASDSPLGIKHHMKNVWVGYIDGEMSLNEKAEVIRDFQQARDKGFERAFLGLVACGLEGMNIPEADGLWFADPKNSHITIDQVTGRIERLFKGKIVAHIGMPLHLKSTEEEEIQDAASRTGYETIVNRYNVMDAEDFDGTVRLNQDGIRVYPRGYKRDNVGEEIPELTAPDNVPHHVAEQLREALITREFERRYPSHLQHFEMLQEAFEDQDNWEFLLGKRKELPCPESFWWFIANLRSLAFNGQSAYSNYLPWLEENNFPFETGRELYHKIWFTPRFNKVKEIIGSNQDWREDDESKTFVQQQRSTMNKVLRGVSSKEKSMQTEDQLKMLDDLLSHNWRHPKLYDLKINVDFVLLDPESARSGQLISRWRSKHDSWKDNKIKYGKEKFKLVDDLFKQIGESWDATKVIHKWTKGQEKALKENWETTSDVDLAQQLGITSGKISHKRKQLKLVRTKEIKAAATLTANKNNIDDLIKEEERMIKKARAYYKKNGNSLTIKLTRKDHIKMDKDLQRFLTRQRDLDSGAKTREYTDGVLPSTRKALDDMEFVWDLNEKIPVINCQPYMKYGKAQPRYAFFIKLNGKGRTYGRKTRAEAQAVLALVLEKGKHLGKYENSALGYWDEKELKILRDNWQNMTDKELAKLIPAKNEKSITSKRSRLGFKKTGSNAERIEAASKK